MQSYFKVSLSKKFKVELGVKNEGRGNWKFWVNKLDISDIHVEFTAAEGDKLSPDRVEVIFVVEFLVVFSRSDLSVRILETLTPRAHINPPPPPPSSIL